MRSLSLAWLLAAATVASADDICDTIPLHGRPMEGEIVSETWKEVAVLDHGARLTYALSDLTGDIAYDEATIPQSLFAARAKAAAGAPGQAAALYEKTLAQKTLRPALRQRALFELARTHRLANRPDDAAETLRALLVEFPDGRFVREAWTFLVDGLMLQAKYDDARKAAADGLAAAKSLELPAEFADGLRLRDAALFERLNKDAQALATFSALARNASPAIAFAAQVGVGRCQARAKKTDDARASFESVTRNCTDRSILIGAWNGLGDCALDAGKGNPKEALFCFLRGVTLYLPGPDEPADEHERSLARAAACLKRMAEAEPVREKRETCLARAADLGDRLRTENPDSAWLKDLERPK